MFNVQSFLDKKTCKVLKVNGALLVPLDVTHCPYSVSCYIKKIITDFS